MAVATITTKLFDITQPAARTVQRKPLPAGQPREWYETHNRRLKAMRLAIALLDSGCTTRRTRPTGRSVRRRR